jgi:hypothetical protein
MKIVVNDSTTRRKFLRAGLISGVVVLSAGQPLLAAESNKDNKEERRLRRQKT